jgi:hypothetical protein
MDEQILQSVVKLVAESQGINSEKISADSYLVKDLGIVGMDGDDLIEDFVSQFNIDMSAYQDRHFPPELPASPLEDYIVVGVAIAAIVYFLFNNIILSILSGILSAWLYVRYVYQYVEVDWIPYWLRKKSNPDIIDLQISDLAAIAESGTWLLETYQTHLDNQQS